MTQQKLSNESLSPRTLGNDLSQSWRELVTYELLFKLLTFAALTPLSAALFAWLISLSGDVSLSNGRIASFVVSPLGVLTIFVWSVVGFTVTLTEQAGLLLIAASKLRERPLPALHAILIGLRRTLDFARLAALQVVLGSVVVLPLLGIAGLIYALLLGDHDINFYLVERPPKFILAVIVGGVLAMLGGVTLAWLQLRFLFALPRCVLDNAGAIQSMLESWRLTRGLSWRHLKVFVVWGIAVLFISITTALLVRLFAETAADWAGDRLPVLMPTLAILAALHISAAALVGFLTATSFSLLMARLYMIACVEGRQSFVAIVDERPLSTSTAVRLLTKRRVAFAFVGVFFGLALVTAWGMIELIDAEDSFAVTAHRGSSLRAPENTIAAIELAIDERADYIEIDVQETADGRIVMLHDKDFMRLAGVNQSIWETRFDDLADLDIGSWFDPRFHDQRVPLLTEVIDATRDKVKLNIELKFNGHDEDLARRVVDIIRDETFERQCVISSLDQQGLRDVQRLAPELKTGLITAVSIGDLSQTDADFLSVSESRVTQALIDDAHRRGKEVHVWTVNDVKTANRLIDMGADNLLTDDPLLLIELRRQRAEFSIAERLLLQFRRWLRE